MAILCIATATWLVLRPAGLPGGYSTGGVMRYLAHRLAGHPKLQVVTDPLLAGINRVLQHEPPDAPLHDLGKGQRTTGLEPQTYDADGIPIEATTRSTVSDGGTPTRLVHDADELARAMTAAQPGEVIELAPGTYAIRNTLYAGRPGTATRPIAVRARRPGTAEIQVSAIQGVLLEHSFWLFENLTWRGMCRKTHDDCEHAIHVAGGARGTVIRNNLMIDFNAHIKINGKASEWPDAGLMQFNTLTSTGPRRTERPVTPFDLVGASGWKIADNRIEAFVKDGSNGVSYGLFVKGGGRNARIVRNLVVCTPKMVWQRGLRVGISVGNGGTDAPYCRGSCEAEHHDAWVANNVVAHCNDVGIDVARSRATRVLNNTLINTAGILVRRPPADALAANNLLDGHLQARHGATLLTEANITSLRLDGHLAAPDLLDLRWLRPPAESGAPSRVNDDFCGQPRSAISWPGATQQPRC